MASQPPPLPTKLNLRFATALNVFLPGAGLFYLGRRRIGAALAGMFLVCFFAIAILFLVGYSHYLSIAMSENLMEGNKLEEAGAAFHQRWLIGLALGGAAIYILSSILFSAAKNRLASTQDGSPPNGDSI